MISTHPCSATVDDVIRTAQGLGGKTKRLADGSYMVTCAAHDDSTPSLHVDTGDGGRLLLHCFGCDGSFEKLLDALGLYARSSKTHVKIVATEQKREPQVGESWVKVAEYEYRDADGEIVHTIPRSELHAADGSPILGRNGKPIKKFDSTGITKQTRIPYRLDSLNAAKASGARVFFVEGEKCADHIFDELGEFATTLGSHGNFDAKLHAKYFDGIKQLIVIPDESHESKESFANAANALSDLVQDVRYVELPGLEREQDIVDFWQGGEPQEALNELIEKATALRPTFELVSAIADEPDEEPQWLINDLIPDNQETVCLYGRPRTGKSLAMLEISLALSTGTPAFGMERFAVPRPVSVLYIAEEDPRVPTRRRLKAFLMGRGITEPQAPFRISIKKGWHFDRKADQDAIIEQALRYEARFVALDPLIRLTRLIGGAGIDFAPFADFMMRFTAETGVTLGCVHHDKKNSFTPGGDAESHQDSIAGGGVLAAMTAPIHIVKLKGNERQMVPNDYKFFQAPASFAYTLETPTGLDERHSDYYMRLVGETKSEDRAKAEAAEDSVRAFLRENPCANARTLRDSVKGNHGAIDHAVKALKAVGDIVVHDGKGTTKHHRLQEQPCECEREVLRPEPSRSGGPKREKRRRLVNL